jgi:uncharacterized surface protein with fasciclin (FAS1) repeats
MKIRIVALSAAVIAASLAISPLAIAGGGQEKAAKKAIKKAVETSKQTAASSMDIVETAVAAGSFKTLVSAVQAAGLVETLKSEGPFTVFAPTDEAFAKLPEETLEELLRPESKGTLQGILTYHVVSGKVMAADVVKVDSVQTVQGGKLSIVVDDGKVMVDTALVVKTDIEASNGVIHVIDTVVLPKED